jgi:hypothetical protein
MYSQKEVIAKDKIIFNWSRDHCDLVTERSKAIHDSTMKTLLHDYIHSKGRQVVIVLGGHSMSRHSNSYKKVVLLTKVSRWL